MAKWAVMWAGTIASFVVFVTVATIILLGGDREFPTSGDHGFKLLYPTDLPLTGVHFFIDSAKNPTNILFFAVVDVEKREDYALIALEIPYSGQLKDDILFFAVVDVEKREDYALIALEIPYSGQLKDESGWEWRPFEDKTLFVKNFTCSAVDPCSFVDNIQYLQFELDEQIDQKQSFRHSVRLWFSEVNPLLDQQISPLIGIFNPDRKPYQVGFSEIESAMATVILDKSSDSFGPTPEAPIVPGPRPNTIELDWPIQGGILHQIDYQLPKERNQETQLLYYTALFGITLGITSLSMFGIEKRRKKPKDDQAKSGDSK
jgi:hypothetical protein